jgi:hypothetical protein
MKYLKLFEQFINEAVKPEDVDFTFNNIDKLREEGKRVENPQIIWMIPTDEYIKEEIYEIPENLATVWLKEKPQTGNLFPKMIEKLIELLPGDSGNLLKQGDVINGGIITNDIKKQIIEHKEIQDEVKNVIGNKGKLVDWSSDKISQTGNMGTLKDVTKYSVDKEVKSSGENGIIEFIEFAKTLESPAHAKSDLVNYLPTYLELLENGKTEQFAPFVVNVSHEAGKNYHCIGGHKRSTICNQLGLPLKVWFIEF